MSRVVEKHIEEDNLISCESTSRNTLAPSFGPKKSKVLKLSLEQSICNFLFFFLNNF